MNLCKMLKKKDVGATGIGAMIVFIATVLVAGIAASVMIQTSMRLESQAMSTGQKTVEEVASGLAVTDVAGYCVLSSGKISRMTITVRPRAGSPDVDLNQTFIELSNGSAKIILGYSGTLADSWYDSATGVNNIFSLAAFPAVANRYGIVPMEDADSSCNLTTPIINIGDKVMLCIDTSKTFSESAGILVRTDILGAVIPEDGSPAVIGFTTPNSYGAETIFDLQ